MSSYLVPALLIKNNEITRERGQNLNPGNEEHLIPISELQLGGSPQAAAMDKLKRFPVHAQSHKHVVLFNSIAFPKIMHVSVPHTDHIQGTS